MANQPVERKPSDTALFNAMRRTIACKEYQNSRFGADYLAEYFLPAKFRFFLRFKSIRVKTRARLDSFFPGVNEYVIARTTYFDGLFLEALKNRTPQIVLLGAGYDSRAYRFAMQNQGTQIFELDSAPTQERKKECLKKAKIAIPPQVAFVSINFNREALQEVLGMAGWQDSQKTLFLWEGVSYYLNPGSVDQTLDFFSQSAQPGSLLAFDYMISISEENVGEYYGAKEMIQSMQEHHSDEGLTFAVEEGRIGSFLAHRNLKLVEHVDPDELEKSFLTTDEGALIGKVAGHFRIVLVAPMS